MIPSIIILSTIWGFNGLAVFTMSYENGLKLINSIEDTECFWIYPDNTTKRTDGLDNLIQLSQ